MNLVRHFTCYILHTFNICNVHLIKCVLIWEVNSNANENEYGNGNGTNQVDYEYLRAQRSKNKHGIRQMLTEKYSNLKYIHWIYRKRCKINCQTSNFTCNSQINFINFIQLKLPKHIHITHINHTHKKTREKIECFGPTVFLMNCTECFSDCWRWNSIFRMKCSPNIIAIADLQIFIGKWHVYFIVH